jgi:uncharacterized protein involved in exopolysaccharide biosynthesis
MGNATCPKCGAENIAETGEFSHFECGSYYDENFRCKMIFTQSYRCELSLAKKDLAAAKKELAELKSKADAYRARWQAEKEELGKVKSLRQQIDAAKVEMEQAERRYDLNKAAEIRHGRLPALEKELAALKKQIAEDSARAKSILGAAS